MPDFVFITAIFLIAVIPICFILYTELELYTEFSIFFLLFFIAYILIYAFVYTISFKYIKKFADYDKYKNNIVKYITIDNNNLHIVGKKNLILDSYAISQLKSVNLNIKTCAYGGRYSFSLGFKYIIATFELEDGKRYWTYIRKTGWFAFIRTMRLIYKIIDYIHDNNKFSYKISGHYNSPQIAERIELYLKNKTKTYTPEIKEYVTGFCIILIFVLFLYFILLQ